MEIAVSQSLAVRDAAPDFVDPGELIDADEAASLLAVKVQTLATWRSQNRGPEYYKVGRCVRYRRNGIGAFIATKKIVPAGAR
jgi:hypothetical protein